MIGLLGFTREIVETVLVGVWRISDIIEKW